MESITFHCEVITPMFLAGADGQTPELRAPSIKGAMRFWWRAMNGHLVEEKNGKWDYSTLKKEEGKIFGDTKKRSSFNIVVEEVSLMEEFEFDTEFSKEIQYFQYSLVHHNERKGIKPGFRFSIQISAFKYEVLKEVVYILWILSHYGGLGTRVRRGAGAFSIEAEYDKDRLEGLDFLDETPLSIGLPNVSNNENAQDYSSINYGTSGFIHGVGFSTWEETMKDIAKRMMHVRDGKTVQQIKKLPRGQSAFKQRDLDKKAAFGLPINVFGGGMVNLENKNENGEYKEARRGSPVYISITKIGRAYHWTALFLEGKFMPEDSKIVFKDKEWPKEDDSLLLEFKEKLKSATEDAFFSDEEPSVMKIKIS